MASRGHLGGLAWAAPQAVRVLDAAGFDVVLLETVGVGQSEVEVAGAADTTVAARPRHGRRHPGGQGRDPRGRRRLRRQQGRPARGRDRAPRPALDARPSRSAATPTGSRRSCRCRRSGEGVEEVVAEDPRPPRLLTLSGGARASEAPSRSRRGRGARRDALRRRWGRRARPVRAGRLAARVVGGSRTPTPRPTRCWIDREHRCRGSAGRPRLCGLSDVHPPATERLLGEQVRGGPWYPASPSAVGPDNHRCASCDPVDCTLDVSPGYAGELQLEPTSALRPSMRTGSLDVPASAAARTSAPRWTTSHAASAVEAVGRPACRCSARLVSRASLRLQSTYVDRVVHRSAVRRAARDRPADAGLSTMDRDQDQTWTGVLVTAPGRDRSVRRPSSLLLLAHRELHADPVRGRAVSCTTLTVRSHFRRRRVALADWVGRRRGSTSWSTTPASTLTCGRRGPSRSCVDGHEVHWRTNYLGTAQLTRLLLGALLAAGEARVVNVVSKLHDRGRNECLFGRSRRTTPGRRTGPRSWRSCTRRPRSSGGTATPTLHGYSLHPARSTPGSRTAGSDGAGARPPAQARGTAGAADAGLARGRCPHHRLLRDLAEAVPAATTGARPSEPSSSPTPRRGRAARRAGRRGLASPRDAAVRPDRRGRSSVGTDWAGVPRCTRSPP